MWSSRGQSCRSPLTSAAGTFARLGELSNLSGLYACERGGYHPPARRAAEPPNLKHVRHAVQRVAQGCGGALWSHGQRTKGARAQPPTLHELSDVDLRLARRFRVEVADLRGQRRNELQDRCTKLVCRQLQKHETQALHTHAARTHAGRAVRGAARMRMRPRLHDLLLVVQAER